MTKRRVRGSRIDSARSSTLGRRSTAGSAPARSSDVADLAEAFKNAVAFHQAGRLDAAEKNYRRILGAQPDHFGSLHLLGVIAHQRGNHAEAVLQIDAALKINPNVAEALSNRGIALMELKRPDEALASYDKAIALKPDSAETFYNRVDPLAELKRPD